MTVIYVMTPQGRLNADQRRILAKTLTDAVLDEVLELWDRPQLLVGTAVSYDSIGGLERRL